MRGSRIPGPQPIRQPNLLGRVMARELFASSVQVLFLYTKGRRYAPLALQTSLVCKCNARLELALVRRALTANGVAALGSLFFPLYFFCPISTLQRTYVGTHSLVYSTRHARLLLLATHPPLQLALLQSPNIPRPTTNQPPRPRSLPPTARSDSPAQWRPTRSWRRSSRGGARSSSR
jgi:hypothetical protein